MTNYHSLRVTAPVFALAMCLGLGACGSAPETAQSEAAPAAGLPEGWAVRADSGPGTENQLMMADGAYHFKLADNAVFYNPAWTSTGDHTFSATLTQTAKASHPTSYGLMFGGSNLDNDMQMYSYFLVRQSGEYYVATRNGADVTTVVPWTANAAIMAEGADGTQVNTLSVQVAGDQVIFSINGAEVNRLPAAGLHASGLNGFRIGHRLEITASNVTN